MKTFLITDPGFNSSVFHSTRSTIFATISKKYSGYQGWNNVITGTDKKSLQAIEMLLTGSKPSALSIHGFTPSQSKKLSQFVNCLKKLEEHTHSEHINKWKKLGLKGLVLLPLFKKGDWEGLIDTLASIDHEIKREELAKYPALIEEKRSQVKTMESNTKRHLNNLQLKKNELIERIDAASKERELVKQKLPIWTKDIDNPDTLDFLMDHLGIKDGKLCLAKRLDYRWQKNLTKKKVIVYGGGLNIETLEKDYTHWVHDVHALAKEYETRKKRGYRVHWDADKVPVSDYYWWEPPDDPKYANIQSLLQIKGRKLKSEKNRIRGIEKEIEELEEKLKKFRKRRPESFAEALKRSNQFASFDMERHGNLQLLGLKWLYNQGYFATTEFTLPNGLRADVIGVNEKGSICILECKASFGDYQADTKWENYLVFCDHFYFVADNCLSNHIVGPSTEDKCGVLRAHKTYLEVFQECPKLQQAEQSKEIAFLIGRNLSKRFSFGHSF